MRKPSFGSPGRPNFESKINKKRDQETTPTINWNFKPQYLKNYQNKIPKSTRNLWKSRSGLPRVHPAAPKVLQSGPEMPKCFPRVLPRCQNGPQGITLEAPNPPNSNRQKLKGSHCFQPSLPNGNPRSQKGPAAEGVAHKISTIVFKYVLTNLG